LTAVDDLGEATLHARPTMSQVTARLEMLKLLAAMGLDRALAGATAEQGRDAALRRAPLVRHAAPSISPNKNGGIAASVFYFVIC
jgi:hypothetical protein